MSRRTRSRSGQDSGELVWYRDEEQLFRIGRLLRSTASELWVKPLREARTDSDRPNGDFEVSRSPSASSVASRSWASIAGENEDDQAEGQHRGKDEVVSVLRGDAIVQQDGPAGGLRLDRANLAEALLHRHAAGLCFTQLPELRKADCLNREAFSREMIILNPFRGVGAARGSSRPSTPASKPQASSSKRSRMGHVYTDAILRAYSTTPAQVEGAGDGAPPSSGSGAAQHLPAHLYQFLQMQVCSQGGGRDARKEHTHLYFTGPEPCTKLSALREAVLYLGRDVETRSSPAGAGLHVSRRSSFSAVADLLFQGGSFLWRFAPPVVSFSCDELTLATPVGAALSCEHRCCVHNFFRFAQKRTQDVRLDEDEAEFLAALQAFEVPVDELCKLVCSAAAEQQCGDIFEDDVRRGRGIHAEVVENVIAHVNTKLREGIAAAGSGAAVDDSRVVAEEVVEEQSSYARAKSALSAKSCSVPRSRPRDDGPAKTTGTPVAPSSDLCVSPIFGAEGAGAADGQQHEDLAAFLRDVVAYWDFKVHYPGRQVAVDLWAVAACLYQSGCESPRDFESLLRLQFPGMVLNLAAVAEGDACTPPHLSFDAKTCVLSIATPSWSCDTADEQGAGRTRCYDLRDCFLFPLIHGDNSINAAPAAESDSDSRRAFCIGALERLESVLADYSALIAKASANTDLPDSPRTRSDENDQNEGDDDACQNISTAFVYCFGINRSQSPHVFDQRFVAQQLAVYGLGEDPSLASYYSWSSLRDFFFLYGDRFQGDTLEEKYAAFEGLFPGWVNDGKVYGNEEFVTLLQQLPSIFAPEDGAGPCAAAIAAGDEASGSDMDARFNSRDIGPREHDQRDYPAALDHMMHESVEDLGATRRIALVPSGSAASSLQSVGADGRIAEVVGKAEEKEVGLEDSLSPAEFVRKIRGAANVDGAQHHGAARVQNTGEQHPSIIIEEDSLADIDLGGLRPIAAAVPMQSQPVGGHQQQHRGNDGAADKKLIDFYKMELKGLEASRKQAEGPTTSSPSSSRSLPSYGGSAPSQAVEQTMPFLSGRAVPGPAGERSPTSKIGAYSSSAPLPATSRSRLQHLSVTRTPELPDYAAQLQATPAFSYEDELEFCTASGTTKVSPQKSITMARQAISPRKSSTHGVPLSERIKWNVQGTSPSLVDAGVGYHGDTYTLPNNNAAAPTAPGSSTSGSKTSVATGASTAASTAATSKATRSPPKGKNENRTASASHRFLGKSMENGKETTSRPAVPTAGSAMHLTPMKVKPTSRSPPKRSKLRGATRSGSRTSRSTPPLVTLMPCHRRSAATRSAAQRGEDVTPAQVEAALEHADAVYAEARQKAGEEGDWHEDRMNLKFAGVVQGGEDGEEQVQPGGQHHVDLGLPQRAAISLQDPTHLQLADAEQHLIPSSASTKCGSAASSHAGVSSGTSSHCSPPSSQKTFLGTNFSPNTVLAFSSEGKKKDEMNFLELCENQNSSDEGPQAQAKAPESASHDFLVASDQHAELRNLAWDWQRGVLQPGGAAAHTYGQHPLPASYRLHQSNSRMVTNTMMQNRSSLAARMLGLPLAPEDTMPLVNVNINLTSCVKPVEGKTARPPAGRRAPSPPKRDETDGSLQLLPGRTGDASPARLEPASGPGTGCTGGADDTVAGLVVREEHEHEFAGEVLLDVEDDHGLRPESFELFDQDPRQGEQTATTRKGEAEGEDPLLALDDSTEIQFEAVPMTSVVSTPLERIPEEPAGDEGEGSVVHSQQELRVHDIVDESGGQSRNRSRSGSLVVRDEEDVERLCSDVPKQGEQQQPHHHQHHLPARVDLLDPVPKPSRSASKTSDDSGRKQEPSPLQAFLPQFEPSPGYAEEGDKGDGYFEDVEDVVLIPAREPSEGADAERWDDEQALAGIGEEQGPAPEQPLDSPPLVLGHGVERIVSTPAEHSQDPGRATGEQYGNAGKQADAQAIVKRRSPFGAVRLRTRSRRSSPVSSCSSSSLSGDTGDPLARQLEVVDIGGVAELDQRASPPETVLEKADMKMMLVPVPVVVHDASRTPSVIQQVLRPESCSSRDGRELGKDQREIARIENFAKRRGVRNSGDDRGPPMNAGEDFPQSAGGAARHISPWSTSTSPSTSKSNSNLKAASTYRIKQSPLEKVQRALDESLLGEAAGAVDGFPKVKQRSFSCNAMDDYYFSDETVLHPFPRTFLMSQKSEGSLQASPLYPPAEKENINKRSKLFDTNRRSRNNESTSCTTERSGNFSAHSCPVQPRKSKASQSYASHKWRRRADNEERRMKTVRAASHAGEASSASPSSCDAIPGSATRVAADPDVNSLRALPSPARSAAPKKMKRPPRPLFNNDHRPVAVVDIAPSVEIETAMLLGEQRENPSRSRTRSVERRRSKAAKRIQRRWRSRNLHKELSREAAAITQKTQRLEELRKRKAAVQLLCAFVRVYGAEILEDF